MNFTFTNPVCEVKVLRFLDLETEERVFVTGTDVSNTLLERMRVPPGGHTRATSLVTSNYFNVASLYIEFGEGVKRATGAIAALDFRICIRKLLLSPHKSSPIFSYIINSLHRR